MSPVEFNATIIPPAIDLTKEEVPEPPVPERQEACVRPSCPVMPHSDLGEAMPVIFMTIGIAYLCGMISGGLIFSAPSIE